MNSFESLGIIKNKAVFDETKLNEFTTSINALKSELKMGKKPIS